VAAWSPSGGDLAVAGQAPERGWRLRTGGLATSSTRARRWRRDGSALHHLVDPKTGLPPVPVWWTVTAAADSCVRANTVTTAAIVRSHEAWPALRASGLPVRLVSVVGDVRTVGGWPEAGAA